jgi:cytochrome c oxidase accessory protein FixG
MSDPDLIDVQEIAPAEVAEMDPYQHREKIYTRKIEGFFQRLRLYTGWPLLLGYLLLPWLNWDGRQAILFDLPARKFHILGLTLWPQDFPLLAFMMIIAAFALFTVTVFAGRVWCGYTCPQTVWTSIFMWWEQKSEGSRNQRIKRDNSGWNLDKIWRKFLKHSGWLVVAFVTGLTFVGYFYPVKALVVELASFSTGIQQFAWTAFFTCATYINAGWLREKVCTHMCPYARFQSVMFDQDTLIVSYDPHRGETRGSRKRGIDYAAQGLGDCIDCELCVQVCPTGIDIRNGLQYECIGCALCIDACNSVMEKMSYDPGLISYTSEHQLDGGTTHWIRPRLIGYLLVVTLMTGLFSYHLFTRVPLELTVIRDRSQLYIATDSGAIENIYTLHLVNMDKESHQFEITISGVKNAIINGQTLYALSGGEVREISLRVSARPEVLNSPSSVLTFEAQATERPNLRALSESRFLKPL